MPTKYQRTYFKENTRILIDKILKKYIYSYSSIDHSFYQATDTEKMK